MQKYFNLDGCLIHLVNLVEEDSHAPKTILQKVKMVFDQLWRLFTNNMQSYTVAL